MANISAAIATADRYFHRYIGSPWLWHGLNFVVSLGIVTLLFAMIFKMLPDVVMRWSDVWIGAAATALLFTGGKLLIGLYVGHSGFASVYGAAGSLVLILAWVYYSSLILFLGAEFTRVYANRYGGHIVPTANAEPLTPETRAQQGMEPHTSGPASERPAA